MRVIVPLRHPAPVWHVPPRGRATRLTFVASAVEIGIPEVPADAPRPWFEGGAPRGDVFADTLRLPDTGEAIWRRLLTSAKQPVHRDAFRSFLEGADGEGIPWPRGTPLCTWGAGLDARARPDPGMRFGRGETIPEEALGKVVGDGRVRAAEAAAAFASGRYRICGDGVLVRLTALALSRSDGVTSLNPCGAGPAPRLWHADEAVAGAGEQAAVVDMLRRGGPGRTGRPGSTGFARVRFGTEEPDDPFAAPRVALDSHVPLVRRAILASARRRAAIPARAAEVEPLLAAAAGLEPLEVAALTGTCGRGGSEARGEALRAVIRAVDLMCEVPSFRGEPGHDLDFDDRRQAVQVSFAMRRAYLPTLAPPEHEAEDADFIAELGGPR